MNDTVEPNAAVCGQRCLHRVASWGRLQSYNTPHRHHTYNVDDEGGKWQVWAQAMKAAGGWFWMTPKEKWCHLCPEIKKTKVSNDTKRC